MPTPPPAMIRGARRRSVDLQDPGEAEIFAGLWGQAAFPRLPCDAPFALEDLVEDVENPRRVFTVHRASRRHNFQQLVQKFVVQLREGCGSSTCNTPSCFSCRKRIAGRAPVRRYNTTSARTIAVFLASQDNPESGLCPSLRPSKAPPAALNSLIFSAKSPSYAPRSAPVRSIPSSPSKGKANVPTPPLTPSSRAAPGSQNGHAQSRENGQSKTPDSWDFAVMEKPVNKDHRSFAANMFGTVAFKMLEWLTPVGLDELSRKASEFSAESPMEGQSDATARPVSPTVRSQNAQNEDRQAECTVAPAKVTTAEDGRREARAAERASSSASPISTTSPPASSLAAPVDVPSPQNGATDASGERSLKGDSAPGIPAAPPAANGAAASPRPATPRRNSAARVRAPSSTKPKRNVSIDTLSADQAAIADELLSVLKSPRIHASLPLPLDKSSRTALKSATSTIPRPISQVSSTFEGVPLEKMPPPNNHSGRDASVNTSGSRSTKTSLSQNDGAQSGCGGGTESGDRISRSPLASSSSDRSYVAVSPCESDSALEPEFRQFLPQSMSRLTPELVDFFCDVLQDDRTAETHLFEPDVVDRTHQVRQGISHPQPHSHSHRKSRSERLQRRKAALSSPYPVDMMYRWMMFIEQSFFYVLSDPRRLIRSFTKKGQLFDSHTLWYCMLRMSRVAPSVVMHSLWQASDALFVPPAGVIRPLRESSAATAAKLFPEHARLGLRGSNSSQQQSLSNNEAGLLLSICLHMLIAIAPVAFSKDELQDMSRLRSRGLVLTRGASRDGSGTSSAPLCMAYNDAFSNELAVRLARRLFAAISTRQYFDQLAALQDADDQRDSSKLEVVSNSLAGEQQSAEFVDVLQPLFQQLDFLNSDIMYILHFSLPHRAVHEIRAPTLLLDWARHVMLLEWDGQPAVPCDGPFGGALALIKAMYQKRRMLVLADSHFLADYFADRLDEVEVPVSWLTFTPTRQRVHLLDFPFIFNPATLVTFFRAINFARMSRAFEESSSLQERMNAIAPPRGSLIVNPHHRHVLQEMLRNASAKYLVLSVSRERVLEDAFDQLWRREERELIRPLKIRLGEGGGEEGVDIGGVQQEFFRMAIAQALDPDFGAFTVDERTRMTWFNPASPEPDWKFEMVGLLFSLAVFNGLTLPVTFPEALYRKLLGEPVEELHHIADGWRDLHCGLTTLLDWDEKDGLVEDVFARTYEFSVDVFGEAVSREMKPSGEAGGDEWPAFPSKYSVAGFSSRPYASSSSAAGPSTLHEGNPPDAPLVTKDNRDAYVSDYIRYLTDVSVRPQYEAFARGFRTCLNAKGLSLLTPKLLQSVVEGVQEIDVAELRRHVRYVGWDASHRSIRDFWAVVRRFDPPMLRRLMEFVTASDRVPVGGMKNIQFVVQRNGEEEKEGGHLPTAYTCFGTLLLPEYPDRESLRERLCMALQNAQGFGFS